MNRGSIYSRRVRPACFAAQHPRAGLSLLEVLVACGILVIGLTSIAALLPAAGTLLSQANQEDRAGIMAANARADIICRGLVTADLFGPNDKSKACVFGHVLPAAATLATATSAVAVASGTTLGSRIDVTRGFVLEDDLVYRPTVTAETPVNSFFDAGNGPREYREGICWGATLVPDPPPAVSGGRATLGIAVFKKAGACQVLTLTGTTGAALYTTGVSNGLADEATRKRFLAGCTHVLALTNPPQWRRVQASWTMLGRSYVVLDPPLDPGSTLNVVGFEYLIRLDQHRVTLE